MTVDNCVSMVSQHSLSRLRLLVDGINVSSLMLLLGREERNSSSLLPKNETISQMECFPSAQWQRNVFFLQDILKPYETVHQK